MGEISKIQRGASPRPISDKKWYDTENKTVGWVRIGDVTNSFKFLDKTEDYFSEEGIKKSRFIPKGSLIMSICATIGKPIITNMDVCIHDGFIGFSELKGINEEFLYYNLNILENKFCSLGQTGSQANLNSDLVRDTKINIPSIKEQEKIVDFLSKIDKKIELLEKKQYNLLNFKKSILKRIFLSKKLNSWNEYKISDLGIFKSGYAFKNKYQGFLNYPIPFFKVSDMNFNSKYMEKSQNTVNEEMCSEMKCKILERPSIILAKLGEAIYLERKRIAEKPCIIDNNLLAFQPNDDYDLEFIYYMFLNYQLSKYAQQTAVPSLSPKDIGDIKCFVPNSIVEQRKISKIFLTLDKKIELNEFLLLNTKRFKKGLLQKMFI